MFHSSFVFICCIHALLKAHVYNILDNDSWDVPQYATQNHCTTCILYTHNHKYLMRVKVLGWKTVNSQFVYSLKELRYI